MLFRSDFLRSLDTPIVTIGNKIAEDIPFVSIQEKKAAKEATEEILRKGYGKIVFVCPPLERKEENTYVHHAGYNGGPHHVRDAMALARRDGRNANRWREVAPYILKLSDPKYYRDPIVKNGYMRGSETVDYVDKIRSRWADRKSVV